MSTKVKKALDLFSSGFNCCQAVVGAFREQYGLDEKLSMKLSSGFGGGLRCGEVCGAVTGAVMIIGLKYGQDSANDKDSKIKCYEITEEFINEYVKRKKTVLCRELLMSAKSPDKKKEVCHKAIEEAVLLLEHMGL